VLADCRRGRSLWRGQSQTTLIGPSDEALVTVMFSRANPKRTRVFARMISDPRYKRAVVAPSGLRWWTSRLSEARRLP